jgi:hypothetical protein
MGVCFFRRLQVLSHVMNRRQFLQRVSAASLAALGTGAPQRAFAGATQKIAPSADAIILLWMGGGMAHTETFDPKRFTAFAPGIETASVLSTFEPAVQPRGKG